LKVSVIGSTGYGGMELLRILKRHPEFQIASYVSSSQAGRPLNRSFPHMPQLTETFCDLDVKQICDSADLIFFATPAGVSKEYAPLFVEEGKIVIDLSGDFRLSDPGQYETWYQKPAADRKYLDMAVYGLSEWFSEELKTAQLISNPGCYPTAALLALLPLLKEKCLDPASVIIDAKSGVTGAGRAARQQNLFSEINENLHPYKISHHQHIPEIEQVASGLAGTDVRVQFVPHLVPMNRGILVTIYAQPLNKYTKADLLQLYEETYAPEPFVRVLKDKWPETKAVQGSNFCDIGVQVDERTGRFVILAAIDNLMKGAAGQAVQNANIRMGCPVTAGLDMDPLYP
jgi:N-acetyl-gamma-glutamyl-phosphate reductase